MRYLIIDEAMKIDQKTIDLLHSRIKKNNKLSNWRVFYFEEQNQ